MVVRMGHGAWRPHASQPHTNKKAKRAVVRRVDVVLVHTFFLRLLLFELESRAGRGRRAFEI